MFRFVGYDGLESFNGRTLFEITTDPIRSLGFPLPAPVKLGELRPLARRCRIGRMSRQGKDCRMLA